MSGVIISGSLFQKSFSSYPVAAWSLDHMTRLKSTSGGIFAELAKVFLGAGGYVAGAVMDGVHVNHIVTNSLADLPRFQGSKYLQSRTQGIYKKVKSLLANSRQVLFSGTPCQIAGLRYFLEKKEYQDNLIAVEVICHGVPSRKVMEKFLYYTKSITEIVNFRDKRYGWKKSYGLTVKNQGEEGYIPYEDNYFTKIFLSGNALRQSCYNCPFASEGSYADISLGDFWQLKRWPEEQEAGVSAVILRTEKGEAFFRKCTGIHKENVTWEDVASGNPRLCSGKHLSLMRWHPLRVNLGKNLASMEPLQFLQLYSGRTKLTPSTFWIKVANRIYAYGLRWQRRKLCLVRRICG